MSSIRAAGKRPQAHTRTRFIVCVTIAPRSYFTDICRIPYRNAPFLPHPRRTAMRSFFIFYMIRAVSLCFAPHYRRARNRKAMRNLSALSG